MLADIFTGETGLAEMPFLIAVILGLVAAFLAWPERNRRPRSAGWPSPPRPGFLLL